jgi:endo-alpha-1,4-polygalactosaminidase (GH114 family)
VSEFNPAEFLRRLDDGEFDGVLIDEVDKLSEEEVEELALMLTRQMRVEAAGRATDPG